MTALPKRRNENFDGWYILDEKNVPVPASCRLWVEFDRNDPARKVVGRTEVGDSFVSTVFLGLDHSRLSPGPPLLFESMIFGGPLDQEQWRYSTWSEAEEGHLEAVRLARRSQHEKE